MHCTCSQRDLRSCPPRRSSDLEPARRLPIRRRHSRRPLPGMARDRKSTRLNSSHVEISYAVFCLKKKKMIAVARTSDRVHSSCGIFRLSRMPSGSLYTANVVVCRIPLFFFFNDTATTEIYTLSLHDALPISASSPTEPLPSRAGNSSAEPFLSRSEEHTSELQSRRDLVCRLLLEKKKTK